jgi:hypothetical protein
VAENTGSTEPMCGRPATSPWPAGHVLVHFQKRFCLRVQQRRCSRYPLPKGGARRKLGRPAQLHGRSADLTCGPHAPNLRLEHRLTPPINTILLPPVESVKKVRFSPPPRASKFNICRGLSGLSGVLGVAQAQKLYRNPFGFDGVF